MKKLFLFTSFIFSSLLQAQVGIGTVTPEAQLDIRSSNQALPTNNDGILIPKIDEFPVTIPTAAQDGMMVFATGDGSVDKGFYYWDDALIAWVAVGTGSGGEDWYEEGTITVPDNINDDIYTFGNVAIGKNTSDYKLDIFEDTADTAAYINLAGASANPISGLTTEITNTGDGSQRGLNTILNTSGLGTHTGSYVTLNGDGSGETRAFFASIGGNGTGIQRGFYANLNNANDGNHFGALNVLRGNGNGTHYGVNNILQGEGIGAHYAMRNDILGAGTGTQLGIRSIISNTGDGNHYGVYNTLTGTGQGYQLGVNNVIDNSGDSNHFGILNQLSGTGSGIHYGIRNEITGTGTGDQEGMSTLISNSNDASHYGINTRLSGNGNGNHTGMLVNLTSTGTGFQTGMRSNLSGGSGNLTGYWTEFSGTLGNGNQIGAYNSYFSGGNGILAGAYTEIRSSVTGTGNQYGTFLTNSSTGTGTHYGAYHTLAGTGTGEQYGVYNAISNTGNATQVGVRNILSGAGSGAHIGDFSTFNSGSGNLTGNWTEFDGTLGNGNQICAYNSYFSGGNGILAGAYTDIRNSVTGTGSHYGTFTSNDSPGGGAHYGNYNSLSGTGTGAKYGSYNTIPAATGGIHYGVYSNVQKVGSYAGYFNGLLTITNGDLGIRNTAPNYDIHLKQTTSTAIGRGGFAFENAASTDAWKIYHSGLHFSFAENGIRRAYIEAGTGEYMVTSDRNLKKHIEPMANVLPVISKIGTYSYNYLDQDSNAIKTLGVMAQEVEPYFPELVGHNEEGQLAMNYAGLSVVAIKAIQEQQTEIEVLKQQLEQQKAELLELKKLLIANHN